ncbi:MAG: tape measure protein [Candidatus Riflebacteria bacterium]|nr:tape measure protein [Candidatus Riflebacteria bacterium]
MAKGKPIGSFYVQLGLNTQEFRKNLEGAQRDLKRTFGSAAVQTSQILAVSMTALAGAIATVGVASVTLAADLQTQTKSFERLLGSADAADAKLRELQDFAANTPFTFTELTEYTKRLLALGFQASETKSVLTTLGDAASGLGLQADGIGRLIKAFGDIRSKGMLQTQEIKQLAENGIPAFEILAQKLRVSIPEAIEMVEARSIDSGTAIKAFIEGINERFGGMMKIQSEEILGMWSTVRDETENIMRNIGSQIIKYFDIKAAMQKIRDGIQELRVEVEKSGLTAAMWNMMGQPMRLGVIATAGAITGALIPAVHSLTISLGLALIPLAKLAALGASIAILAYTLKKLAEATKDFFKWANADAENFKTLVGAVFTGLAQNIKSLFLRMFKWILDMLAEISLDSFSRGIFTNMSGKVNEALISVQKSIKETKEIALDAINAIDAAANKKTWYENFRETFDYVKNQATDVKNRFTGLFPKQEKPIAPNSESVSSKAWKDSVKEAKQLSESIEREWTDTTKSQYEQIESWYKKEQKTLEDSKKANADYLRDKQRLYEIYTKKLGKLNQESAESIEREWNSIGTNDEFKQIDLWYEQELKKLNELKKGSADFQKSRDTLDQLFAAKKELKRTEFDAEAIRKQIELEGELADAQYESFMRLQEFRNGMVLEHQLMADMQAADLTEYIKHLNEKNSVFRAHLEGQRELIDTYNRLNAEAYRSDASYMAEAYQSVFYNLSETLTDVITGARNAGEAFKQLGLQIVQMVVKWTVQQKLAAAMSKGIEAAATISSIANAKVLSSAWAPTAALVAAATFGASTASAAVGLTSLVGMSKTLAAIPGFANGGIVTKPTLAMIGEGSEAEAVIPLSKLKNMISSGNSNIEINVINNTPSQVQARANQNVDGTRVFVELFNDAANRNVGGFRDIIFGGRR